MSQRSAASGSLRSSSPLVARRAPRRRSPLPDMTKFSSSGRSSFRTGRASKSSAPPTGRATSHPPYCEESLVLDASFGGVQIFAAVASVIGGGLAPKIWQRQDLAR